MNNNFIVIGRITRDLELRYTKDHKAVLELPLAISNGKDDTTFLNVSVFGTIAETINKFCKKGDLLGVKGIIKNNNYEDKNGNKHYEYRFLAERVSFLQMKKEDKKEEEKKEVEIPNSYKTEYDNINSDIKIDDSMLPF